MNSPLTSSLLVALLSLAACSRDPLAALTDGGAADSSLSLQCSPFPQFGRSCASMNDCFVAVHQIDCCGSRVALGLARSEQARFDALEAQCEKGFPACGCAQRRTVADDGNSEMALPIAVDCVSGQCRSFVPTGVPARDAGTGPSCGGNSDGTCSSNALACTCCPAGGPTQHCLCSTPCTRDSDCPDSTRPACTAPMPGAMGFCAPRDFMCCWLCK